ARCSAVPPPKYIIPSDTAVVPPPPPARSNTRTFAPARAASIAAHAPAAPSPTTTTSAPASQWAISRAGSGLGRPRARFAAIGTPENASNCEWIGDLVNDCQLVISAPPAYPRRDAQAHRRAHPRRRRRGVRGARLRRRLARRRGRPGRDPAAGDLQPLREQ